MITTRLIDRLLAYVVSEGRQRRRMHRGGIRPAGVRLGFELLEPRQLLSAVTLSFQNGVSSYRGTLDTELRGNQATTNRGAATSVNVDGDDGGYPVHGLVRFDTIFGTSTGRIPTDRQILGATLLVNVFNAGNPITVRRMLTSWSASSTWNSMGSGVQSDGKEAAANAETTTAAVPVGTLSIDVTRSLRAWQADPSLNYGWALLPTGTDGVDFYSAQAATVAMRPKLVVTYDTSASRALLAGSLFFQDSAGPDANYRGTVDVDLRGATPNSSNGGAASVNVDGSDAGSAVHGLLRFDRLFGTAASQVSTGSRITQATLLLNVTDPGNAMGVYRMLTPWSESATWNSVSGGIQANGSEAAANAEFTTATVPLGTLAIDVTASVRAWQANPATNFGWALLPTGTDGVDFSSREASTATTHPKLVVDFDTLGIDPQYKVNQSPRLQLGNAPPVGYAGSGTDQAEILWQTTRAGTGTQDRFVVDYRRVGGAWTAAAPPPQTLATGVGGRVVQSVTLKGLAYNADYEYRVRQFRDGIPIAVWQNRFHTRLAAGDATGFSFAAYGDAAGVSTLDNFRQVQGRISQTAAAFSLLLGDNVYETGTHAELDLRLDPTVNPEAAQWTAGHVDYVGIGNHDIGANLGKATEDSYSVPIPVAGTTAVATPPSSERAEHNYAFDYGRAHFVTFDTNSYTDAARLDAQLKWVEADLKASTASWKIVFAHHPVIGTPDKMADPVANYYQQVVPRLLAAGANLLLVGHSHTYSWTYPLTGSVNGLPTFVTDTDKNYAKGAGLVQVVSGVGGREIRAGSYPANSFVAAGYTSSSSPKAQAGFTLIDVTSGRLTVSYVAAASGSLIDRFTITAPTLSGLARTQSASLSSNPSAVQPTSTRTVETTGAIDLLMARGEVFAADKRNATATADDRLSQLSQSRSSSTVSNGTKLGRLPATLLHHV